MVADVYRHLGSLFEVWTRRWSAEGDRTDLPASGIAQDPAGRGSELG